MKNSIEQTIKRIRRFSLTCTLNDNGHLRYFHNGYEYVEIGGIKWATCNVGANSVTDYGLYFQWGDTQGYTAEQVRNGEKRFDWDNYKYASYGNLTKYNSSDKKIVLEPLDDAAAFNMGVGWRMPTREEFQALGNATNTAWTYNYQGSGVTGLICTDKTDSSKVLFFPAVGYCCNGWVSDIDSYGHYLSSSLNSDYVDGAWYSYFYNEGTIWDGSSNRYYGFAVRGVVG